MKKLLAAALICLSFACGQVSDETSPMADDISAAKMDPLAQLPLAEKAAAEYVANPRISRIEGDYVKSSKNYTWTYSIAGDDAIWATVKVSNGKATLVEHHEQIDILPGVGFYDRSDIKVSFAKFLKICRQQGFATMPVQISLLRPHMDPMAILKDAEWYAEYGSKGSVDVDAVTGKLGY